jgi:UDP-N-acetyl-D-mannosaminuronic acid dehydrogenase
MIKKIRTRFIGKKTCENKNLRVTILGCGYVGLPTAALFADAGFNVAAIDIKSSIVKSVNEGVSPIDEPGLNQLVSRNVKCKRLKAETYSTATLNETAAFIITVPTPVSKNKKPDLTFLISTIETVSAFLKKEAMVAVCSTIPPGTMQGKLRPILESLSGLIADRDFYLAYVPERIAPGKALKEFVESPRLVGGIGPNSTKMIGELFRTVCTKIIETDAATAEIAKTAENTYRDINIAFANQLALICEQNGADVTKVIELANTHPRVNIHASGPGVGGPCLTKDPYLLIYGTEFENHDLISTARKTNDYMPKHVVKLTLNALKSTGKNITNSRIAILGTAYKADVGDSRQSPSEPIIDELIGLGAEIIVYDPHCTATFGAKKAKSVSEGAKGSDCLIILTEHSEFRNIDLQMLRELMNVNPIIVDGRRIIDSNKAEWLGFDYRGIGYSKQKTIQLNENNSCRNISLTIAQTVSQYPPDNQSLEE